MRLYGTWRVSGLPDGEQYTWEPDEVLPDEERLILAESGYDTYREWMAGIDEREANAVQTLVWWLKSRHKRGGQRLDRADVVFPHRKVELEQLEPPPSMDGRPESQADSTESSATSAADSSSPSSTDTESDRATGSS